MKDCTYRYPRAERGKKVGGKIEKDTTEVEKSLYINRFEAVFGGHRHRIGPGTGSDQFFPATCSRQR